MKSPVISPIQQTRPSRMPAALGVMLLTIFAASAPAIANTVSFVTGTAVDIGAAGSYTSGTLPTTANDVDFDSSITYTNPTALLLSAASLSIGTINDLNSSALVITETNNQTITLNGGSNSIGGTANDDIYVAGGASMNLDVTTIIPTALTSAYFDSAGALTVGLVTGLGVTIGDGSNATSLTFNGAGATTINGTSNFGASATGASGTVTLNNTGGGAVIFNGPIILTNGSNHSNLTVNASNGPITLSGIRSCGSGSSLTLEGGNTITINSGYVSGYGTGGLINAGSFYVTESGAGTVVNLNASTTSNNGSSGWYYTLGAGATLNFGAANSIESTLNISSATINNTSGSAIASAFSTTANTTNINSGFTWGGSNSLVLNSAATLGTSSGTAVTITANGGALLEISGSISNGSTANQLVLTNGYFELGGTNSSYSGGTVVQSGTLVGLANGSFGSGPITMGTASGAVNVKLLINGGSNANAITTAAGDTGGVEIGNGTSASATDSGLITLNTNLLVAQSSGGSISLTGTLTGSASPSTPVTITTNGPANDITLGSVQDGSGSGSPVNIVNANSGNVNLIAPGAYSGGTQIPVGSVTAAASGALGSGPVALGTSSGGASAALYVNSGIETNAITVAGTATMTIGNSTAASSTESGLIILNDNLQITQANGGSLTFTGTFIGPSVSGTAATLTFAPSASGTVYAANISDGSSPVSVTTGPGTMVFDGTNTYSGATTISGGIVDYQGNAAFDSTGGITQSSTTGAIQLQGNISSASTTTLTLSGTGGLTGATGALDNVSGNNSLANPIVIATGPTTISSDSGTLTLTGGVTGAHTLDLNAGAGSITFSSGTLNNLAIVNVGTGTGIVTINAPIGAGDTTGVTDSSTSSLLVLAGANTYTGPTTVSAGATLQFDGYPAMSSTSTLALANNSTVNLLADTSGTFTPATISLPSSGNTAININVGALTTASNNAVTLSGALTYAGGGTALTNSLNVTASNGYTFNLGVLNLPSSANNFAFGLNVSAGSVMNTGTVEFGSYGQNFTVGGYGVVNITSLGFGSNSTSNFIVGNGTSEPTVTLLSPDYSFNNRAGGNFYVIVNSGTLNLNAYGDVANPSSSSTPTATLNSGGTLNLNIAGDLSGIGPLIINGGTLNNMGASANTGASESTNQLNGDFAWSGSNSLTLNGAATLGGSGSSIRTITTSGTGILVFANAISTTGSGPTQIDLAGTGAIQLNGADTFTGGITLNGPQLYIDNATALGGGGLTVNSGTFGNNSSTVSLTDTASQTWNGSNIAFDGPNSLTTGTVTLNASPSLTVTAGTLTVPSVTGPGLSITLASGGGALALTGSNNIASVTMSGGILIDTNSNALGSGTFTINGGTLDNTASTATAIANPIQINGDFGYRGTHSITLSGSAALSGSNRTITTAGSGTLTLTGVISGSSQLTEAGTGYLALNGTNTYSGGTVINATLSVGNGSSENVSALGSGTVAINTGGELIFNPGGTSTTYDTANSIVLNGGVLNGGDGVQHIGTGVGATINVTAAGGTLGSQYNGKSLYLDGQLTGSGPLTVENFQQTYSSNSVTHITNNSNTYSGVITLDATAVMGEQIEVDAADALQYATVNLVGTEGSASGLLWNSSAPVLGAIEGNGNFQLETNSSGGVALTVGGNNASTTYSGVISTGTGGVGSLTKTGAGTMILSGSSTYTGLTTVSQGALIVTGSISGAVSDSGTFGGSGAVGGLVTVNQNGVLEPGALETTAAGAQLTLQSGLTLAGTSTLVINLDSSDNIDSLAITGNLTLGADDTLTLNLLSGANLDQPSYTIATVTGGIISGSFANTNLPENYQVETVGNSLELVAVPEPGTIGIVLGGFAMLIGMQRCRRTRVKS